MCIFVIILSLLLKNKNKDFYLRPLWHKYLPFFFFFFVTLKGFVFIIGELVWLYCSDNLQNSKTNMTKNRDKIVNRDISKQNRDIFFPYRPPLFDDFQPTLYYCNVSNICK